MSITDGTSGSIAVIPDSPVGEWARWCSRTRNTPVEALDVGGHPHTVFVADRVVVDSENGVLANEG